jgi:hypothetical protein
LLFDVAALLITSAALGPAAEVSSAPANFSVTQIVDVSDDAPPITINGVGLFVSSDVLGPTLPGTSVASVAGLNGIDLLRSLAVLSPAQLDRIIHDDPALVSRILSSPPSASDVTSLWTSLDAKQRQQLASAAPRLVGSLDGVPANVRDAANRSWVSTSISAIELQLPGEEGRALAQTDQHKLHMLKMVENAVKSAHAPASAKGSAEPPRTLLSVDASGQGKAVIVVGNLQTADYVTYLVPGMFYTVDGDLGGFAGAAADVYAQQVSWLHRLSATHPEDAHKTVAVVAWMGYHTPDLTNVGSLGLAYQARDALTRSIQGLRALRSASEPYTTIIAHSYGSTAALMALTNYGISVNALAVVGSPGSAAQSVKDLDVSDGKVWVGAAAWDPVPNSAFFGSDPGASSYGAHTMGVGGGTDPITGQSLSQSIGHNDYFTAGTESIRNMALIGIDEGSLVMR